MHKKELEMFASKKCSSKRVALFGPSRTKSSTKLGSGLFFPRNVDKNYLLLPFPPICIVYDGKIGLTVGALAVIPMHTIIAECVGEVTTMEKSYNTSSDSLMILLETGDPKTI